MESVSWRSEATARHKADRPALRASFSQIISLEFNLNLSTFHFKMDIREEKENAIEKKVILINYKLQYSVQINNIRVNQIVRI